MVPSRERFLGFRHPSSVSRATASTRTEGGPVLSSVRSQDLWSRVAMSWLHHPVNAADHTRAIALLLARPDAGAPIYAHAYEPGTGRGRVGVNTPVFDRYSRRIRGQVRPRAGVLDHRTPT